MIKIFFISFLFVSFSVHAQRTKIVTNTTKKSNGFSSFTEKYSVLADDRTTRHGQYEKMNSRKKVLVRGYYKNGKKDSLWTAYDRWKGFVASQGYYTDDKKTGTWILHKDADTVELKYDYDNSHLIYFKPDTAKKFMVLSGNDTVRTVLQQPPIFLDGSQVISDAIFENISYPDEARENSIEGRILVGITVYADGHVSSPWIVSGVHKSINDEALKVAGKISGHWLPGILNDAAVTSVFIVPIVFKFE